MEDGGKDLTVVALIVIGGAVIAAAVAIAAAAAAAAVCGGVDLYLDPEISLSNSSFSCFLGVDHVGCCQRRRCKGVG